MISNRKTSLLITENSVNVFKMHWWPPSMKQMALRISKTCACVLHDEEYNDIAMIGKNSFECMIDKRPTYNNK